jgi:hypothetical protein
MFSGETPGTAREEARSPERVTRRIPSSEVRTQLREIIWVSAKERALIEVWDSGGVLAAEHRTDELRLQRHSDAKLRDRGGLCSSAWSNRRRSHVLGEPAEQPFRMLTEMVVSVETLVGFLNPKQFLFVSTQGCSLFVLRGRAGTMKRSLVALASGYLQRVLGRLIAGHRMCPAQMMAHLLSEFL